MDSFKFWVMSCNHGISTSFNIISLIGGLAQALNKEYFKGEEILNDDHVSDMFLQALSSEESAPDIAQSARDVILTLEACDEFVKEPPFPCLYNNADHSLPEKKKLSGDSIANGVFWGMIGFGFMGGRASIRRV